jgi:hypothetical protein
MKTKSGNIWYNTRIFVVILAFLLPLALEAQRGGGRPAGQRPAGNQSRPAAVKPAASPGRSVNNTNQKPASRSIKKTKPSNDIKKGGDTKISTGDKTKGSNNKVNIDNSKKNMNVNVDKSKNVNINNNRNVVVRPAPRPYARPPYRYGGHSYYCYHPYHYHAYHPYRWGPMWHPWGFVVAAMATTAIIIAVESQQYHYDQGVYYMPSNGGYVVVQAPIGATITTLPPGYQTVVVTETTNNYYYGGTYYEKTDKGYTVVPPTAGTIVESLPEGGKEEKIGDVTYVKVGETYYQPTQKDGKDVYEVVEVKAGE